MISFVWPAGKPMLAGTGGSETYTAGHVRELINRGIEAQVVTIGKRAAKKCKEFSDIPFVSLDKSSEISALDGTIIFVNKPYAVKTKNKAAIIFHCALIKMPPDRNRVREIAKDKVIIATSNFNAQQVANYLKIPKKDVHVVWPFAHPAFGEVERLKSPKKNVRIVYAGRLHPEKGIYRVLELLGEKEVVENGYNIDIVTAGQHEAIGRIIANILKRHPLARLIPARKTVQSMAKLLADTDILLMPSVYKEPFGMLSVEAQHAGCRVVATDIGGIPETDCGLINLVKFRRKGTLLNAINDAVRLGPVKEKERNIAKKKFTLQASVDALLKILDSHLEYSQSE